jgi:hypothetical protein
MPADKGGMSSGDCDKAGRAGHEHGAPTPPALTSWSILRPLTVPPSMIAELARLRAAFPAFSISIRPGWRGLTFEAWRDSAATGLYALISQDAGELWRVLDASQAPSVREAR